MSGAKEAAVIDLLPGVYRLETEMGGHRRQWIDPVLAYWRRHVLRAELSVRKIDSGRIWESA